jgi:hypothetical protein
VYQLRVQRQAGVFGKDRKDLLVTTLNRETQVTLPSGEIQIPLLSLGVREKDLEKHVRSGQIIAIELLVIRQSPLFVGGSEVRVVKSLEIRVP